MSCPLRATAPKLVTRKPLDGCILRTYTDEWMAERERPIRCTGFEWDEANADKNWRRHRVTRAECEQVFFNRPFMAAEDTEHSVREPRFYALGQTDARRRLFLVFTIRGEMIRVISARDMSRRERKEYHNAEAREDQESNS
jgi:uncharacterized DUF497 family protein